MNETNETAPPGTVILINKPYKWTSFDVVRKIKNLIKAKKIGHAGTLDPLATGLLILCTEKLTKQIDTYQGQEKEYTGKLILGKTTPSIDLETDFNGDYPIDHITEELIYKSLKKFTGSIEQTPPIYSAIKIDGKRAYSKARKGKTEADVEIKSRIVEIKTFEITNINLPEISFRIECSKGTYIRSLVRDFGEALQSGAYMSELCRTRIGEFKLENAKTIEYFIEAYPKTI